MASARIAGAVARVLRNAEAMEALCGHIPAEQEEILARADFIGGEEEEDEEEAEVFTTPPLTQQAGEDVIVMCSLPFTQTQPSSPSDDSSAQSDGGRERKRPPESPKDRVCTTKVRADTKIRPPSPMAPAPSPAPPALAPTPPAPALAPLRLRTVDPGRKLDPLTRIVLMIPTPPLPTSGHKDFLELARSRGIQF